MNPPFPDYVRRPIDYVAAARATNDRGMIAALRDEEPASLAESVMFWTVIAVASALLAVGVFAWVTM